MRNLKASIDAGRLIRDRWSRPLRFDVLGENRLTFQSRFPRQFWVTFRAGNRFERGTMDSGQRWV